MENNKTKYFLTEVNPGYQIKDGNVFYTKGNSRKEKMLFVNQVQITDLKGCGTIFIVDHFIISFFWDLGVLIFDFNGVVVKRFNNYSIASLVIDEEYFTIRNISDNSHHRVSCRDFNIVGSSKVNYAFQKSSLGFNVENNIISAFLINEEYKIWEYIFSLQSDVLVRKFLGITNNRLFILLNPGHLIVLDIRDGSLIKTIYPEHFSFTGDTFMHPEDKHIYCLHHAFVKINTEMLEVETVKQITKSSGGKNELNVLEGIKSSSYQGKYISFTSFTNLRTGFAKWIGLFDYETGKIVWHDELLPEDGQLSFSAGESPLLADNKLYILDTDNTLHIMQQEV